jgi:hypothetical protein
MDRPVEAVRDYRLKVELDALWRPARAAGFAAAIALLGAAAPAFAQRGLVADSPTIPGGTPITGCALGSACASNGLLDVQAIKAGFGSDNLYIYSDGIVSFGAPLPLTASLAGGTASFGDGTWFAPGIGAPLAITAFTSEEGNQWWSWTDTHGDVLFQFQVRQDVTCSSCTSGPPFWNPTDTDLADFTFGFNGPGRGVEAFNLAPLTAPDETCGDPNVTTFSGLAPLDCPAHYHTGLSGSGGSGGTPEPASWALMILGFGTVGSLLRRRRYLAA